MLTVYLAGPDVFLPSAREHAVRKVEICARYGVLGLAPIDADGPVPDAPAPVYGSNRALMLRSDAIVANLSPFRGVLADDGTAFELGFFDALRRPAFAYSNARATFAVRTRAFLTRLPDPIPLDVEDFGLPANLMLACAVMTRGGLPVFTPEDGRDRALDDLDVFERLMARVAERCAPLDRLRAAAEAVFGGNAEAATGYLHRPSEVSGGSTPAELVLADPSAERRLVQSLGRSAA